MRMKGTQEVEVNINDAQIINAVLWMLRKRHNLPNGVYLSEDKTKWLIEVEVCGHHRYDVTETHREVCAGDIEAFAAIKEVEELLKQ